MTELRALETQEMVADYISSLQELTINSKPHINLLTILAEENIVHASAIVEAIEGHLHTVKSEIKLPVLYLIDSIIKNVDKNPAYLRLFTKNIVTTFCHVFERVDENTRACMWKLRATWNNVFSSKKLYNLDVKVNAIDPAWPVSSAPDVPLPSATSIHVNPKFLSMQQQAKHQQQQKQQQAATQPAAVAPVPALAVAPIVVAHPAEVKLLPSLSHIADKAEAEMREQLFKKQKELLDLQKQKIDLELLQVKASLEQQRRQFDKQNTLLKPEMHLLAHGTLDKPVTGITGTNHIVKPIEKQFPAATAALMKSDLNKTGIKIAPASSIAVAAAKSVTSSRDPRLKSATTGTPAAKPAVATPSAEEFANQKLMQQFKLHMQSKLSGDQSSLLNDAMLKGTSEPEKNKSLDNKRAKDACQKKDPCIPITNATIALTSPRSNSIVKEQSKSSVTKSSSTRNSSSSKTSSSSSRKVGSKSRSKSSSSSNSPSPNKIAKLEDSSPPSSDSKRSSSKKPSSSSKSSHKTHSPNPACAPSSNGSYRIPRRSNNAQDAIAAASSASGKSSSATGLVEEEQSGSPIVSAPHPPAASFKELRSSTRNRNYIRRNKEGSRSPPDIIIDGVKDSPTPNVSKDEDLRAPIVSVNVVALASLDTKEDLDLRVLAVPTGKRQSSDILESANTKKSKTEKIDALFGNEDTDLRTLTNPKAGRPPTPPPPVISSENQNKDKGWAKIKTSIKTDRETPKPLSDRNRDRLGRLRLHNKTEDPKDRRMRPPAANRDLEKHSENKDLHMEQMMKEAAEQLNHGSISKGQYNKLIQQVLQMNEDQKLRAAQRKEQEGGMLVWEKNMDGPNYSGGNDENVRKEHPNMHTRGQGPGGPRWQGHWNQSPWAHPPPPGPFPPGGPPGFPPGGSPDGFRPRGSWQNHARLCGPGPGPMRPDFNHFPRMGAPPMGLYRPPMMMPNGPMHAMGVGPMGPMPPGMMMANGPVRPDMKKNNIPNAGPGTNNFNNTSPNAPGVKGPNAAAAEPNKANLSSPKNSGELPPPDPELLAEIAKDTTKSINIDNRLREIRYYGTVGIVFLSWDDPRDIGFQDGTRRIFIDGKETMICNFNTDYKEFTYENEKHKIKLGTPTRELYVNGKWYECYFGGPPIGVELGQKTVNISLEGPPPQVKIGFSKRTDLVLGKINLIINARNMVPVFLDAKPQMFEIEDQPCTLEFCDALQTVLLNGRPFKVEFGGLPKPIMVLEKKHFIRFSVLPRGFRAGYVRIANMKGERPRTPSQSEIVEAKLGATPATSTVNAVTASTSATTNVPVNVDLDSASQDGMDVGASSKTDLQLDVLSSVMISAMAPATGQSYQAEPAENAPAPTTAVAMPLYLNTLFQRLVETGIVPSLDNLDAKKPEEEEKKEPEVNPVTFDKPETLKTKQPTVSALYSGVQCGTCEERWEDATRYSRHLDWHFRQNRKERDSARKAHSRSWHYDVNDWIQFEEVEDMEDRPQSWFETEKQTAEIEGATADASPLKTQQPSVPTGSDEEACCVMCHEAFEQFYNNEKDEWHLYPTVKFEDKNYHPLCLEDHKSALEKSALELEEVIAEMEEATDKEEVQKDEGEKDVTIKEEKDKEENVEITGVPDVKPEIKKGEEDNKKSIKDEKVEMDEKDEKSENVDVDDSEPIEIIEPLPRQIVLEEIDDSSDDENNEASKKDKAQESNNNKSENKPEEKIPDDVPLIFENVKVKEEPIDETEVEESIAEAAAVDTTQVEVKSSIDGNVEFQSAALSMPAASSKIKINITKNLAPPKSPPTDSKEKEKKPAESPVQTAPAKPLIPAAIKSALQGKKLSILPTVEKGHELSGLCRLM